MFVDPPSLSDGRVALCAGGLPGDGRLDDGWCITGRAVPGIARGTKEE